MGDSYRRIHNARSTGQMQRTDSDYRVAKLIKTLCQLPPICTQCTEVYFVQLKVNLHRFVVRKSLGMEKDERRAFSKDIIKDFFHKVVCSQVF